MTAPTVLVADDQPEEREAVAELLGRAGYRVLHARDGAEAIRMVHENHPDLVVMDIVMPVMDGLAATRHLKDDPATASIPVLVLTGDQANATRENALAAGCNTYIAKPLNPMGFVSLVNHWLRRYNRRRGRRRRRGRLASDCDWIDVLAARRKREPNPVPSRSDAPPRASPRLLRVHVLHVIAIENVVDRLDSQRRISQPTEMAPLETNRRLGGNDGL